MTDAESVATMATSPLSGAAVAGRGCCVVIMYILVAPKFDQGPGVAG